MLVSSGDSLLSALDCADPVFMYSTSSTHCVRILSTKATRHVPRGYSSTVLQVCFTALTLGDPKEQTFTLLDNGDDMQQTEIEVKQGL